MTKQIDNTSSEPVAVAVIGTGNRALKYLQYIFEHPDRARLVAVVDPVALRRERVARSAGLPDGCCFADADDFFDSGIKADAVMICTPEHLHFDQCMAALRHGCHVLLEKPIAGTLDECNRIAAEASARQLTVSVCHVLRYHPYYERLKAVIGMPRLGRVLSISHTTSVGIDRYVHTYVRGTVSAANPVLLSKCCHDVDLLLWLVGGKARRVSSYGSRGFFRAESAPAASTERCIDCPAERQCAFSAVNLYKRRHEWIANFDVAPGETVDDAIDRQLESGRFGRCVFRCDNTGVDHQVLAMETDNGVTINMAMDCMTMADGRTTRIGMTGGEVYGDESRITVRYFDGAPGETYDFTECVDTPYHAGADLRVVEDFINSVAGVSQGPVTSIAESVESHRVCFEAEQSRLKYE